MLITQIFCSLEIVIKIEKQKQKYTEDSYLKFVQKKYKNKKQTKEKSVCSFFETKQNSISRKRVQIQFRYQNIKKFKIFIYFCLLNRKGKQKRYFLLLNDTS